MKNTIINWFKNLFQTVKSFIKSIVIIELFKLDFEAHGIYFLVIRTEKVTKRPYGMLGHTDTVIDKHQYTFLGLDFKYKKFTVFILFWKIDLLTN